MYIRERIVFLNCPVYKKIILLNITN